MAQSNPNHKVAIGQLGVSNDSHTPPAWMASRNSRPPKNIPAIAKTNNSAENVPLTTCSSRRSRIDSSVIGWAHDHHRPAHQATTPGPEQVGQFTSSPR